MYDPATGRFITAPDGNGTAIRFTGDRYIQAGYNALSMSCATRIIYWKTGTYTVQGNKITFRPTESIRQTESCGGSIDVKKGWAEIETVPFQIISGTLTWTDQYGGQSIYYRK